MHLFCDNIMECQGLINKFYTCLHETGGFWSFFRCERLIWTQKNVVIYSFKTGIMSQSHCYCKENPSCQFHSKEMSGELLDRSQPSAHATWSIASPLGWHASPSPSIFSGFHSHDNNFLWAVYTSGRRGNSRSTRPWQRSNQDLSTVWSQCIKPLEF